MTPVPPRFALCESTALENGRHIKAKINFEGRREECLLIRFDGAAYAYINRCVHMPRPLDCEQDIIFDASRRHLRCSMHGIVYIPQTGTSISALCEGQQLRAIGVYEENGQVGLADFRVSAIGA